MCATSFATYTGNRVNRGERGRAGQGRGEKQTHQCFGFLDVLEAEEELAVQVGEIDGVQVDDVDVAEAGEEEVLEQLAADTAGADEEDS